MRARAVATWVTVSSLVKLDQSTFSPTLGSTDMDFICAKAPVEMPITRQAANAETAANLFMEMPPPIRNRVGLDCKPHKRQGALPRHKDMRFNQRRRYQAGD